MKTKLCGLLIGALLCVGVATAGSFNETCPPGGAVLGGSPPGTPPIAGTGVCGAWVIPSGQTLTSIVINIQGDYSAGNLPNSGITNTLNWTYQVTDEGGGAFTASGLTGASTEQVQGNSGSLTYIFNGTGCLQNVSSNNENCTTPEAISGNGVLAFDSFAITAQGSWASGSAGLQPAGVEDFNINVTFNYTPTTSVPEPASLLLIGSGLIGLGVLARRKRKV